MERRKEIRKADTGFGVLSPVSPYPVKEIEYKLINTSPNGISIYCDEDLEKDKMVWIKMSDSRHLFSVRWKKRVNNLDSGIFRYGLEKISSNKD